MQNRLPSWPPLVNQIRTNTEAFNSISRQPEVVFKAHVVCSAGTTPVFWSPNSISSLTKERFDFTRGKRLWLEVSWQDRLLRFGSKRRERGHTNTHTLTCTCTHTHSLQTYPYKILSGRTCTEQIMLHTNKTLHLHTWRQAKWKNTVLFNSSSRRLESISVQRADCATG